MNEHLLHERELMLDETERPRPIQNLVPRDASTLILLDRSGSQPKVLLGRRHHGHKFMPGKFVFPGGRTELDDRRMPVASPLDPRDEARLMQSCKRPTATKARALALAAVRETAEETGIVVGRKTSGVNGPGGSWAPFEAAGVLPDLANLHFIARAITPPRRPRRFDTRFFVADASCIAHQVDGLVHAETELVELVWLPIPETADLDLPRITRVVLDELQRHGDEIFSRQRPVPFFKTIRGEARRFDLD